MSDEQVTTQKALADRLDNMARFQRENLSGKGRFNNFLNGNLATEAATLLRSLPAAPAGGVREALAHAADIALSIDSGRGNERQIAISIRQYATQLGLAVASGQEK